MSRWTSFFAKRAGIGFLCLLFSFFIVFSYGTGEARGHRILALMSYDAAWPTARPFIEGMREALPLGTEIRYIFMDTKNIDIQTARENAMREIVKDETGRARYSAVYVCDDDAFNFVLEYRHTLFRDLPVVFNGVNDIENANRASVYDPLLTGVIEAYPIEETLRIARAIQPEATHAVAFVDGSATGTAAARQFMRCQEAFPELQFSLIDGAKLTQSEIARKCRALDEETIPLFLVLGFDRDGGKLNLQEAIRLVADNSPVPVYRADENGIGDGLVGGAAIEYGETGRAAGTLMRRFLSGEDISGEPPLLAPSIPIFDEALMSRYNITRSVLPPNTKYVHPIPSFLDRYKDVAFPVGIFSALLLTLLIAIWLDSRRSRRLLRETREKENRLRTLVDTIPAGIGLFELDRDGKLSKFYLSNGFYDMLGTKRADRDQSQPDALPYIHPDDRTGVMKEIQACIRGQRELDKIFRMLDGSGNYRWLNLRARFTRHEDGRILAYGCYSDHNAIVEAHRALHAEQAAMLAALAHSGLQAWEYYPERKAARRLVIASPYHFSHGADMIENFPETLIENGIIYDQDMPRFEAMHRQILEGADEAEAVLRIRTKNGGFSWEDIRYTTLRDTDGNPIKILGTSANMDTYKELEGRFLATLRQTGIIVGMYDIPNHHFDMTFRDRHHIYTAAPDDMIAEGVIYPDDAETFREMFRRVQSGKSNVEKTLRCDPDGSGSPRWYRCVFTLVPDREGRPLHVMFTGMDITEQMAREQNYLEEMLRRRTLEKDIISSMTYNLTQDVVQECIIDRKPQDDIKEVGLNALVRREAACIPDPEDRAACLTMLSAESFRLAQRTGKRQTSFDYLRRFPDGQLRWVEGSLDVMENPQTGDTMVFAYIQDIHAKKIGEIANAKAIEGFVDYILCIRASTGEARFIRPPKGAPDPERLKTGFDYNESLKHMLARINDPEERRSFEDRAKLSKMIADLEKSPNMYASFWQESPVGPRRKETRVSYLDAERTIISITQRDITEMYRAEEKQREALRKALDNAEEASRAKSDFLSRMSHEIRTPMNAIIGLTALARQRVTDTDYITDSLAKVDSAAHFLLGLINDILDISRIERGKMELDNTPHNLEEFLSGIDIIVRARAQDGGVRYQRRTNGKLPAVCLFDELKMKQVLVNILSNAVKFTPKDGYVTFTIEETERNGDRSTLLFMIRDTGVGIEKSFLPRIFGAFEQESAGSTTRFGGTGLGLAISKSIVDLMGGTIEVESEKGEGATFRVQVTLPVAAEETESGTEAATSTENVSFDGKRALLAEDNEINREIATAILEAKGFSIEPACDGKEAVEKFAASSEGEYDLILMDIRMPFLDGFGATEEIRAMKRADAKTIPIIAMTANAFEEDIRHAREVGMNDYLTKPVEPNKIYQTLWKILRNR